MRDLCVMCVSWVLCVCYLGFFMGLFLVCVCYIVLFRCYVCYLGVMCVIWMLYEYGVS